MSSEFKKIKTSSYYEALYFSLAVLPDFHSKMLHCCAFLALIFVMLTRFINLKVTKYKAPAKITDH